MLQLYALIVEYQAYFALLLDRLMQSVRLLKKQDPVFLLTFRFPLSLFCRC